ncbi:anti-repressor SinI family protein [Alkalihalobacillus sp. MEB130]|nr:anti-repressor SinI family protein [Alkalihalobacillus sp. MEB130]MDT8861078.1 anti-repressor SinI family protein [Alkalihalobacillus sp. MEB130]
MITSDTIKETEQEWEQLLLEAREIGLTPDDVREFIKQNSVK